MSDLGALLIIHCFQRFASRRGTPVLIVLDNTKNFKNNGEELNELNQDPEVRAEVDRNGEDCILELKHILERAPY